jgi:hypothetical protein
MRCNGRAASAAVKLTLKGACRSEWRRGVTPFHCPDARLRKRSRQRFSHHQALKHHIQTLVVTFCETETRAPGRK